MSNHFDNFWGRIERLIFLFVFLLFLPAQFVWGDITGKIAGTVADNKGDPLPGANVVLIGTQRGSATDLEGNYYILSVPPGSYSVSATMMGYQKVIKTEVLVQAGRTTLINFGLKESVLELGKEVIITAKRPVIEVDRTSTEHIINAKDHS